MPWEWRPQSCQLRLWVWLLLGSTACCQHRSFNLAGCLENFKSTLSDPQRQLEGWNSTTNDNPCLWPGVDCSRAPDLSLDLQSFGLSGELQLQAFNKCVSWTSLRLSDNNFSGPIPSDICSDIPALVNLDLSDNYLTGPIPASISDCIFLETLQLGSNLLAESIPEELGVLEDLKLLDLSDNRLEGSIPSDLLGRRTLHGSFEGNPGLVVASNYCGSFPGVACAPAEAPMSGLSSKSKSRRLIWMLAAVPVMVLSAVIVVVARKRGNGSRMRTRTGKAPVRAVFRRMGSSGEDLRVRDLWAATGDFDKEHEIGAGGFSTVYKATLQEGSVVAVKWLKAEQKFGPQRQERSFRRELTALLNVKHRNLVQILGYVAKADMRLLILEFMPNGSLEHQLHGVPNPGADSLTPQYVCPLSWQQRCDIALGIAMGLDYLHKDITNPLVHLDLKPSNVLLDSRMVARISDFGLAKLVSQANITTHTVAWTVGYTAPEVFLGAGGTTTKADVYSFGVLLLELITKQRPTSSVFGDGVTLIGWVKQALETESLHTVIDPALTTAWKNEAYKAEITLLCKLGLFCAQHVAAARPDMKAAADIIAKRVYYAFPPSCLNRDRRSDKANPPHRLAQPLE